VFIDLVSSFCKRSWDYETLVHVFLDDLWGLLPIFERLRARNSKSCCHVSHSSFRCLQYIQSATLRGRRNSAIIKYIQIYFLLVTVVHKIKGRKGRLHLLGHHQALIKDIEKTLNTAIVARSPPLHATINYECNYLIFKKGGFKTECVYIHNRSVSI
jgi:hypothetical protein